MDLWTLYAQLGHEVECPKGRGILVQVFSTRAAVFVPGVRRKRSQQEALTFCAPEDIRPAGPRREVDRAAM